MEARRKELGRRQWQKKESTPVLKEKKKFSLFPHHHHRSESHGAAAIQLPVVEQDQQIQDVSAVPPPLERSPPSIVPKLRVLLPKLSVFVTTGWFVGNLKGFFGLRQLPTAQSSPTRQGSTKSTKTTTTIVVVNNRNLFSDDSGVEGSPSKSKGFQALFRSPAKRKSNGKRGWYPRDRVGEKREHL